MLKSNPKDTKPELYFPSLKEARENPEYWELVSNMYQEQASRAMQHQYRKRLERNDWYRNHKHSVFKYDETLKEPFSMRFIPELKNDDQLNDHVAKINSNGWKSINWDDPYFDLNLFKALRLKLITLDQLAIAILLYEAQNEFNNKQYGLKQFSFNENCPYSPASISYATQQNLIDFYERLKKIPKKQQDYFSVNFSRLRDAIFLIDGLESNRYEKNNQLKEKFYFILSRYIEKSKLEPNEKIKMLANVSFLKDYESISTYSMGFFENRERVRNELLNMIYHLEPQCVDAYTKMSSTEKNTDETSRFRKDVSSGQFLGDLLAIGEQLPSVEISPDYDVNNPDSPLLCMIILPPPVFNLLQYAVHGEDTTEIYFTVGKILTRMIRFLDESPEKYNKLIQQRPVELAHSAFHSNEKPHGADAHKFILAWHDIFHTWRNGAQVYKKLARYLRQLLESTKGFDMSKSIWTLSDLDFGVHYLRETLVKSKSKEEIRDAVAKQMKTMFARLNIDFFQNAFSNDESLLITLDMILNREKWENLIGDTPEVIFDMVKSEAFNQRHKSLQKLVMSTPNQSVYYYLIAVRLKITDHILLKALRTIDLKKIFHWERNGGLYFNDEGKKIILSNLSYRELNSHLRSLVVKQNSFAYAEEEQEEMEEEPKKLVKEQGKANEVDEDFELKENTPFKLKKQEIHTDELFFQSSDESDEEESTPRNDKENPESAIPSLF